MLRNGQLIPARVWQLWAVDCATRVLPIFERRFPGDGCPRNAVAVAAGVASGELPSTAAVDTAHTAHAAAEPDWQRKHLLALVKQFA